jgi:hypothetical protein
VFFEKGDYSKAQELLTQYEYDNVYLNIIAKTMLLKVYYALDEYDAFESLIESTRIYLQRKKELETSRKAAYKNMISMMRRMLSINFVSRAQRDKFKELIQNTNPLAEREWFLKQIE